MTNIEKVNQLIKEGWKYDNCGSKYTIVETYRDKWAYTVRDSDGYEHMEKIEYIVEQWNEEEKLKREIERAKSGHSNITKYFQKYGVLHRKPEKNLSSSSKFLSSIIYDGKPTPKYTWNSEIYMKSINVYQGNENNYRNRDGFVNKFEITFDQRKETSIDASIDENGTPKIHHSHNWYDNAHEEYQNHYTNEEWDSDIQKAIEIHMSSIEKLFDDSEILYSSKSETYYQKSKNYLVRRFGDTIYQMEIIDPKNNKFRDIGCNIGKFPKFNKTITKEEIFVSIRKNIREVIDNNGIDHKFKYNMREKKLERIIG